MQSFIKAIFTEGNTHIFYFDKIYTASGIKYHVSVRDTQQQFFFNIEEMEGGFKIIDAPKVPDWIMKIEKQLEEAILENLIR